MKGLRKYLTPFAPDQSGAVSVLYELGGIIVICDAGGCTGNICGFDEPRWFSGKSAVFSAGLRDMDAILGRDDKLVAKLADAAGKLDVSFAAIVGTPVPAVIGTDYHALERMSEKKTDLPILTVDTDGMELYDKGEEKAYLELFRKFSGEKLVAEPGRIGILGMTPQDVSDLNAADKIKKVLEEKDGVKAVCYGMGDGLDEVKKASASEKNLVISPAALEAAKYLEKKFGTPYEAGYPLAEELVPEMDYRGKRILIVHQQIAACAMREVIRRRISRAETDKEEYTAENLKETDNQTAGDYCGTVITNAGWFMMKEGLKEPGDISLKEEDDYIELVKSGGWDIIFADKCMARMTPEFKGAFIDTPHFAVSGRLV